MIYRIEKFLSPNDAIVKSPDWLEDRDSGNMREVDATIRMKGGSAEILIIIECRNRLRIQDVRWIEEIHGKKLSVGADIALAVSSNGFSKQALQKAKALGIQLRMTRNVDVEMIRKICSLVEYSFRYDPENIEIVCDIPHGMEAAYKREFKKINLLDLLDAEIFVNNKDGKLLGLRKMFEYLLHQTKDKFKNIVLPSDLVKMSLDYPKPALTLRLPSGDYNVTKANVDFKFSEYSEKELEPLKAVTYSDGINDLVNAAEYKFKIPGSKKEKALTFHQDNKSGLSIIRIADMDIV